MRERAARRELRRLAQAALEAVEPSQAVLWALRERRVRHSGPVELFALGKAALGMARGALAACDVRGGVVIVPEGTEASGLPPEVEVMFGAHPLPDAEVGRRGAALLERAARSHGHALVLLSGGGSALADVLALGVSIDEVRAANEALLAHGLSIDAVNLVRAGLSRLKGGGLSRALGSRTATTLVLSDVPGAPPSVVASGPMSVYDERDLARVVALPAVRASIGERLCKLARLEPAPARNLEVVGDNETALEAMAVAAGALGRRVARGRPLAGEARARGAVLAEETRVTDADAMVWGGETTVCVRGRGRGGRSHEVALGALVSDVDGSLLAFGTDGIDGSSDAAGAFVDADVRGLHARTPSAEDALGRNDSHAFFAARDAQLRTGPTGTNVADLAIWLRG